MIVGLLSGRKGSKGFPNKNIHSLFGRPLMEYPLRAALNAKSVDRMYVSTDSEEIIRIAKSVSPEVRAIARPAELAQDGSFLEDVLLHAYHWINKDIGEEPEFIVIVLCNAATVKTEIIEQGIEMLRKDPEADSVATVTLLNQYSPVRAKKNCKRETCPGYSARKLWQRNYLRSQLPW